MFRPMRPSPLRHVPVGAPAVNVGFSAGAKTELRPIQEAVVGKVESGHPPRHNYHLSSLVHLGLNALLEGAELGVIIDIRGKNGTPYSAPNEISSRVFRRRGFKDTVYEGVKFERVYFQNCEFEDITFRNCNFSNFRFERLKFTNCKFENCTFSNGFFDTVELEDSTLKNVTAQNARFVIQSSGYSRYGDSFFNPFFSYIHVKYDTKLEQRIRAKDSTQPESGFLYYTGESLSIDLLGRLSKEEIAELSQSEMSEAEKAADEQAFQEFKKELDRLSKIKKPS